MDFCNIVAVVTGAASGLGRSLALQLCAAGAHLALCDVDMPGLEETQRLAQDAGTTVSLHHVDVSDLEQMASFAEQVMAQHGQVDLLINNAGVSLTPTCFADIPDDQFKRVFDINAWGVYNGIRAFLPHLRARPEAGIVNVSSLAGLIGLYGYAPYAMSKAAIRGLSEALQSELAGSGSHVLVVHPGGIKTDIIKNAPNLDDEQRETAHAQFTQFAFLKPDRAARRILRALQRKQPRLILGADAKLVYALRHLFPRRYPAILKAIFSQALFGDDFRSGSIDSEAENDK